MKVRLAEEICKRLYHGVAQYLVAVFIAEFLAVAEGVTRSRPGPELNTGPILELTGHADLCVRRWNRRLCPSR